MDSLVSFFPKINQQEFPGWTTARTKCGRDTPICIAMLITQAIKNTRNKVLTIVYPLYSIKAYLVVYMGMGDLSTLPNLYSTGLKN